jgi:hypothetical protein
LLYESHLSVWSSPFHGVESVETSNDDVIVCAGRYAVYRELTERGIGTLYTTGRNRAPEKSSLTPISWHRSHELHTLRCARMDVSVVERPLRFGARTTALSWCA